MLIIEGSDGVGKTTLAHKLVKGLEHEGYIYRHTARPPMAFDRYWDYVVSCQKKTVVDRFHMSEIVYAYARQDKLPWTMPPQYYRMLDGWLRLIPTYTVILTIDSYMLRVGKEEMYDLDTIKRANDAYLSIAVKDGFCSYGVIDFDLHIHLTETRPWVSDQAVQAILELYRTKMDMFNGLMSRKPISVHW